LKIGVTILAILFASATAAGDDSCFPYCYKCNVIIIDGKSKKVVAETDFKPLTAEEELTHKIVKVPGTTANVHASVFFTDESLASNEGADSIKLGLAVGRNGRGEPGGFNNAMAEVTLNNFDTARVMTPVYTKNRNFVAVLTCQAPSKVEDSGQ